MCGSTPRERAQSSSGTARAMINLRRSRAQAVLCCAAAACCAAAIGQEPPARRLRAADDLSDKTFLYNENVLPTCRSPVALKHPGAFGCVGHGRRSFCAGKTAPLATRWQIFGLTALYVDVDTSVCGLADTPAYFAEVTGADGGGHWELTGTNAC